MALHDVKSQGGVLKVSHNGVILWADDTACSLLGAYDLQGSFFSDFLALNGDKPLAEYFDDIFDAAQLKLRGTSARARAILPAQQLDLAVWVDTSQSDIHYICRINVITEVLDHTPRTRGDILEVISSLQGEYIADRDAYYVFGLALDALLNLTHSEYGFIGEILHDKNQQPFLKNHAITNIAWNKDTQLFYEQNAPIGLEFRNHQTLFGHTVISGEAIIANQPDNHPKSGGRPQGHPPLNHYLGIPIYSGNTFVGMAGIANKPQGYSEDDIELLRPLINTLGMLIVGYQHEQMRRRTDAQLRIKTHELERASDIKSHFLASMSHELRTPLNSILGFSSRLQTSTSDQSERSVSALDTITRNSKHLLRLINDLLDISQIEAGVLTLKNQATNLNICIDEALDTIQSMAAQHGLKIINTTDLSHDKLVEADPVRVLQIILNLTSNAIKYGGNTDVEVWVDNGIRNSKSYRCINVKDYGQGISATHQEQLFKKYSQANANERIEGTGLGLALVSELMALHGGWVEVESRIGYGCTFCVGFPMDNNAA